MRLLSIILLCGAVWLAGCSSGVIAPASRPMMTGTVSYRERIALPASAVLTVRLLDITKPDAPEMVLAERSISNPGNPPMAFSLPYPFGGIVAGRKYVIEARIEVEGRLRFFSVEPHVVTPANAAQPHAILVAMTRDG
ncbi:MAG: YbaY family lipoprotein [Opitutaceae bacterium]|nr:YbaY family lipoprotein [Cephaloticoccus sp.]MCP5529016.1 YbaY family lipoprotein [Opitutaceae bacterium]